MVGYGKKTVVKISTIQYDHSHIAALQYSHTKAPIIFETIQMKREWNIKYKKKTLMRTVSREERSISLKRKKEGKKEEKSSRNSSSTRFYVGIPHNLYLQTCFYYYFVVFVFFCFRVEMCVCWHWSFTYWFRLMFMRYKLRWTIEHCTVCCGAAYKLLNTYSLSRMFGMRAQFWIWCSLM